MNEVNVLVIAAQRWDFDDSEGQNHRGTTVYVAHVNEPQSEYYAGHKPVKYTMSHEQYDSFKAEKLPALSILIKSKAISIRLKCLFSNKSKAAITFLFSSSFLK